MSLENQAISKGEKKAGDFVHQNQTMGTSFKNVSQKWIDKCIDWDTFSNMIEASANRNKDETKELSSIKVGVDENCRVFFENGRKFDLTEHARFQFFGSHLQLGERITELPRHPDELSLMRQFIQARIAHWYNANKDKKFLFRFRDNSLRAILSEQYAIVDHRTIAEILRKRIPDGLISHFRADRFESSNGDYLRANVLIPNSRRLEDDSEYGGMYTFTNSEVGSGKYSVLPSLFRAICMNGCIWGMIADAQYRIKRVHRGNIKYEDLVETISAKLDAAIPLIPVLTDQMLKLKSYVTDGMVALNILGYISKDVLSWSKENRLGLYEAWKVENEISPANTAFSVIQGFTRFAQQVPTEEFATEIETIAGDYVSKWQNIKQWDRIINNAKDFNLAKEFTLAS